MTVSTVASVPFRGQVIEAQKDRETVKVALKPVCENLGLNANGQIQRLKRQPWATTCVIHAVAGDGRQRELVAVDRRAFTMWLATIDTRRVRSQAARDLIIAYQQEAADALDRYFNTGVAVNEHLLKAQHLRRVLCILISWRRRHGSCWPAKWGRPRSSTPHPGPCMCRTT